MARPWACALLLALPLLAQDRALIPTGGRRVALVVGMNAYPEGLRLTAAVPDAKAVEAALPGLGFERRNVFTAYDANLVTLKRTVRSFVESIRSGDTAFVYYAGHGVEVQGRNYLLPVDFSQDGTELAVMDEAYAAQDLLDRLEGSGAKARILVLDACRNNPLRKGRSASRGLVGMDGSGTLIVFPTGAGKVTPDNGLFRREMLKGLSVPGISADDAFKRIGRAVAEQSDEKQIPAIYGLLLRDFAFVAGRVEAAPAPVVSRGPQAGDVRVGKDGLRYVYVPPGKFRMGCSEGDTVCDADESPAHEVQITRGFWMGQTEVTVEAYKRFAAATGQKMPGEPVSGGRKLNAGWMDGAMPMVNVDWNEAKAYCVAAGLRLPTEAEFEYAARAGTTGTYFGTPTEIAWFADNSGREPLNSATLTIIGYQDKLDANGNGFRRVGLKAPNAFGLYDILGNVWEWVEDWYSERYYKDSGGRDPQGPPNGSDRGIRGGGWTVTPKGVRASFRNLHKPLTRENHIGLRCVGNE